MDALELNITWKRVMVIWWAFLWRGIIAFIAFHLIAFMLGFIVGFMEGLFKIELKELYYVVNLLCYLTGIILTFYPISAIIGKDFGEFRLVLLGKRNENL